MKYTSTILAISATVGLTAASSSHAQGITFDGANVHGEYISNIYDGVFNYDQRGIYGSAQLSFGNIAVQADLGAFGYDSNPWVDSDYALHAMYKFSPNFVAGGYYGQNFWSSGLYSYSTYGIETKFTPGFLDGRLTFEAFAGFYQYDQDWSIDGNVMIGVGVDYAVNDNISIGASYLRGAWPDLSDPLDQYDVLELEGTYTSANGLYATASATSTYTYYNVSGDDLTYGIAIGFNFGNGVTFDRRGYSALYPGD